MPKTFWLESLTGRGDLFNQLLVSSDTFQITLESTLKWCQPNVMKVTRLAMFV